MRAIVAVAVVLLLSAGVLVPARSGSGAEDSALVLIVGGQDEMKTRNPLPAIANDVWTTDVLFRVYGSVLLTDPSEERPMAWIAKGVDFDEDGTFEASEYNVWAERPGATNPLEIVVYYDFNGVRWHDGVQMTAWDLLFSYHIYAMSPAFGGGLISDLRVLSCGGSQSSYEATGRCLNVFPYDADPSQAGLQTQWEAPTPGDPVLRAALTFRLNEPYINFYESTLAPPMLPTHIWSRTGGGRHAVDFGCAVWIPQAEATARGIPECGNADPTRHGDGIASTEIVTGSRPYHYPSAEGWAPTNADVIGHGPFTFGQWVPGIETKVLRYEGFYTGVDATTGGVYDAQLASILRKPTIEGIRYKVYKTTQLGVFALQSGEIDFYHWNVGPEFVPDLVKIPEIAVESNAEMRFFTLGYNMRSAPWGYTGTPSVDVGLPIRKAFAHVVDKRSIVQNMLQNFGVPAYGFISPSNTFWYNDNIPKPEFDLAQANAILDDAAQPGGLYDTPGLSLDPPGACSKDTPTGCRTLPGIGNAFFEILTPQADYDPVRHAASLSMASEMRHIGVNAVSRPTAFGEIVNRISAHDFDLFLLSFVRVTDPDALFSFFHSSNAAAGQNYAGVSDPALDACLEAQRRELDRNRRRDIVFRCQEILSDLRPVEPLYLRTNIEGYRQDRFVNWTVHDGTIWNDWSLLGIRPPIPSTERLYVQVTVPSAMFADASEDLIASVFDPRGLAVPGARVRLAVDSGTLTLDGSSGLSVESMTNANGQVSATFTAPLVSDATMVLLTASASHPDFHDSFLLTNVVWVFPPGERFLSLRIELPLGDIVSPGNALPMSIEVRDQDRVLVPDAVLNITSTNESLLRPSRTNGSAAELAAITVEASESISGVETAAVTVTASMPDYHGAEASVGIHILPTSRTYRCATGEIVRDPSDCPPAEPLQDASLVVLAVVAVVAATATAAFVVLRRRR